MSKILDQIEKKYYFTDDTQALVGTELRLRRQGKSRTLEDAASETCSISYLSKIETNSIKANPELLEELCKQFKVTKANLDSINNSLNIYASLLEAKFLENISMLENNFKKVEGLKNYRAILIRFFYFVSIDNLPRAKTIYTDLNKLIKSMQLNDLIIFAYSEALYRFKLNEIDVAYELLKGLENICVPFKYLNCLIYELKSKILFVINSNLYLEQTQILKNIYIDIKAYRKLDKINDEIRYFYAKNGYYSLLKLDEDNEKDHDLLLYKELHNNQEVIYRRGYSNFAKLLYLFKTDKEEFNILYLRCKDLLLSSQRLILDILNYDNTNDDYYKDMLDIFYPQALAYKDEIVLSFVEERLLELLLERKRYRRVIDIIKNKAVRTKGEDVLC